MLRSTTILLIFISFSLACCKSKSNGLSSSKTELNEQFSDKYIGLSNEQAVTRIKDYAKAKQYDAVDSLTRFIISQNLGRGELTAAVKFDTLAFSLMVRSSEMQKNLAYFLFEKRDVIEKDTAALHLFYNFFTDKFTLFFTIQTYDPQYMEVGEYFINLQKKHPWLNEGLLVYFKSFLGIGYNVAGDLKKSSSFYSEVLAYNIKMNYLVDIAGAASNLCTALTESNQFDSVLSITGRLIQTYHFPKSNLLNLHTTRAEACLQKNDLKMAVDEMNLAEKLLPALAGNKDSTKRALEVANIKAMIAFAMGHFEECLRESGIAIHTELKYNEGNYHDRYMGKILLQAGAAFQQLQQPDSALWYFHQAAYTVVKVDSANTSSLPCIADIYAENTLMDALDSMASIWDEAYNRTKNTGFLKQALQARKLAFIAEKKLLEAYSYDEAMLAQLRQSKRRSGRALNNCFKLWNTDHKIQWIQEAILVNENSKAIVLLHSVKRNNFLMSLPEKDSSVELLNRARYQVIQLEKGLNSTNDQKSRDSIHHGLDSVNRNFLLMESSLNQKYPAFKRAGLDTNLISINALQENLLAASDGLLEYFVADTGAFVLWLDNNRNGGMEFLGKELLQVADSFSAECRKQHGLFDKDHPSFIKLAEACARAIIPIQVLQNITGGKCKKMVLVPDGLFSRLPFEALVIEPGIFLINKLEINTGYSLSTLLLNDPVPGGNETFVVFTPFSKQGFLQKARLPYTKDEATAIHSAYPTALFLDDTAASITNFRAAFDRSRIIHIATHASSGTENAPVIFFSDRVLYMPELYASKTKADLVVLSGCETGAGELDPNEGPLSLSRAFYYAGARNVINSLWQIDDAATSGIFSDFYKDYRFGKTGNALRNAKLNFLKQRTGRAAAPYYWAGLIHIGLDKIQKNNNKYQLTVVMLFSVFFLSVMLLLYRHKHLRKTEFV